MDFGYMKLNELLRPSTCCACCIFTLNRFRNVLGEIFTWGDNDEGQLGDSTTTGIQKPRLVAALQVRPSHIITSSTQQSVSPVPIFSLRIRRLIE